MTKTAFVNASWLPLDLIQQEAGNDWEILEITGKEKTDSLSEIRSPEVFIGFQPPSEGQLLDLVKWFLLPSAGVDHLDFEQFKQKGIKVVNCHANATAIAEHGFALLMDCFKQVSKFDRIVRNTKAWPQRRYFHDRNLNLQGKTLGIAGFGAIGQKLATFASAFGMECIIFRKHATESNHFTLDKFTTVANNLDALIIALPLTQETKGLFSKEKLEALPQHAAVVNIGRPQLLDEMALMDMLRKQQLRIAALDVWLNNPFGITKGGVPPEAFVDIQNLIISPYRAWINQDSFNAIALDIGRKLSLISSNKEVPDVVDLSKGY